MIEKIKGLLKNQRLGEILRFGINGGVCFLIDYGVLAIMRFLLDGQHEWISIGTGFTVSVIANYILCVVWVFKGAGKQSLASKLIFIGSSVIGLGITEVLMLFALNVLNMKTLFLTFIAKVVVTLIVMIWNYFMKRIAIYGIKKKEK